MGSSPISIVPMPIRGTVARKVIADTAALATPMAVGSKLRAASHQKTAPRPEVITVVPTKELALCRRVRTEMVRRGSGASEANRSTGLSSGPVLIASSLLARVTLMASG